MAMPGRDVTGKKGICRCSDIQGLKAVFEYIAEPQAYPGIGCTDRADIIIREIFEFRAGFYTPVGFPAFLVIDIIAHGTKITSRVPFLKTPFTNPAFSLHTADRAEVIVGKILKGCAGRNAIMRFAP